MSRLSFVLPRAAAAGAVFATFALAGCTEPVSSPREISPGDASLTQSSELIDATGRHVFHTKEWHQNQAQNGAGHGKPGGGGNTGISYHGGPVLQSTTKVVAIYWANDTIFRNGPTPGTSGLGSADASNVGYFLNHLGGSAYFNINTTYTNGSIPIVNSVQYVGYWANNTNAPTGTQLVSDADMLAMLEQGFKTGGPLTYDPNTLYAIFTSGKVNLGGGFSSPLQYCAYHYHGTVTVNGVSRTVLYAAMPYNYGYPSSCTAGTTPANGDPGADFEVNTLAHEVEETTTDMMGNAWFDVRGYENADKCAWNFGTLTLNGGTANVAIGARNYLVQMNWVNSGSGGCVQKW